MFHDFRFVKFIVQKKGSIVVLKPTRKSSFHLASRGRHCLALPCPAPPRTICSCLFLLVSLRSALLSLARVVINDVTFRLLTRAESVIRCTLLCQRHVSELLFIRHHNT